MTANNVLTVDGHIIFNQLVGLDEDNKDDGVGYARWISTGHNPDTGEMPPYSIQRYNYRTKDRRSYTEVDPYYRAYYRGFRISHIGGKDEFTRVEDAMDCCQRHHYG